MHTKSCPVSIPPKFTWHYVDMTNSRLSTSSKVIVERATDTKRA